MFAKIAKKLFGSRNDRLLKAMSKTIERINALEPEIKKLSDEALRAKTEEYKQRHVNGESLDDLLPEAFATVREASHRVLGMRHFDVQLIGGMVLNSGKIAEMRTGEGKTLVATLPSYLNALAGKGVHVITVNDYLAQRDAGWMGKVHEFLGLRVGVIISQLSQEERQYAYSADITYATNNELGFDYLRDNMVLSAAEKVQRPPWFGIVDEVDSILIDEARTPLIISGASNTTTDLYEKVNELIPYLDQRQGEEGPGDYTIEEKSKEAFLTESGHEKVEQMMAERGMLQPQQSLYDVSNISLVHHLYAALRAHKLFHKDVEYILQNNQIVIVDEFTGRTMPGRRWSNGLHQAIEAKEGALIQQENQTVASITYQNYFRLYKKLSGMTGTADTEAYEFQQIYGLEVVVIPTHRQMVREDRGDLVYLTQQEKYAAILEDIEDCQLRQQPVLVGTASIEVSEVISNLLKEHKIFHEVLNAKQHEREAHIVENAGRPSAVTIATNMAGRGTDIVLGGSLEADLRGVSLEDEAAIQRTKDDWQKRHDQVLASGGLHIIGTERHESRRIDNQLRGRAGRQGDNGSSRFYLSLQDTLMRIFASDKVGGLMQKLGMEKGEAIEHPWVSKAIENAQRKVEAHNFDIRKHLLEYDDVANDQRKVIYEQRDEFMESEEMFSVVSNIMEDVCSKLIDGFIPPQSIDETWDIPGLMEALKHELQLHLDIQSWLDADDKLDEAGIREKILEAMVVQYRRKEELFGAEALRMVEKTLLLKILDLNWKEHLAAMDYLRQGIGLRGYAQKNPKQEYKRESFEMFQELLDRYKHDVVQALMRVEIGFSDEEKRAMSEASAPQHQLKFQHADLSAFDTAPEEQPEENLSDELHAPFVRGERKVGRNDLCPCGSGKKYKQCHGKVS